MQDRSYRAQEWFDHVEADESDWNILWLQRKNKNGCPAHLKANPNQKAWVKPRRYDPEVAAKEKIGSDLAYIFGLPVASALLCSSIPINEKKMPVSITKYSLSESHVSWKRLIKTQAEKNIKEEVLNYFQNNLNTTAGTWVFDTWVRNRDRTDQNIIVGYTSGKLDDVYFIDFDISMNWEGNSESGYIFDPVFVHQSSPHIFNNVQLENCLPYIAKIQALSEEELCEIVDRIPDFFLKNERKEIYKTALLQRREQLLPAFEAFFADFNAVRNNEWWTWKVLKELIGKKKK